MKTIVTLIVIISACFSVYFYIDGHYAKCADVSQAKEQVAQVSQRLDYKIVSDQYRAVQQRIWLIEDRFAAKKMDKTTKEEYQKLQTDKDDLKRQLDGMKQAEKK
jgi:hypothetical protein